MSEVETPEEQPAEEQPTEEPAPEEAASEGQGIFGPPSEMTDEEKEAADAAGFVYSTAPEPEPYPAPPQPVPAGPETDDNREIV